MERTNHLTFQELSTVNARRASRWHPGFPGPDAYWTGADWSNAMCGEAGEAANIVKKLRRVECDLRGALDAPPEELLASLAEEIADVITYADLLATKYGINVAEAIIAKFNKVSDRQGFPEQL